MTLDEFRSEVKINDIVCVIRLDLFAIYRGMWLCSQRKEMLDFITSDGVLCFQIPLSEIRFSKPIQNKKTIDFSCV